MIVQPSDALIDLRGEQTKAGPPGAGRLDRGGGLVLRDAGSIDAICLHQTACTFGVSPGQVRAAKGDRDLAKHRRALGVHAHVTAFMTGRFVAAYPLRAYVYHGNGANGRSIGLEIEGHYDGIPGGKLGDPTVTTIDAARAALTWIIDTCADEGIKIRYLLAHRQYSDSRRSDPGWAIWQRVALDYGVRIHGLTTLPALVDGRGRPIPRAWDATAEAGY